jgi:hypothetical protein
MAPIGDMVEFGIHKDRGSYNKQPPPAKKFRGTPHLPQHTKRFASCQVKENLFEDILSLINMAHVFPHLLSYAQLNA